MNWKEPIKAVLRKVYARKLLQGVKRVGEASLEDLRRPEYVSDVIRQIGLRGDRRFPYGSDNIHANRFGPGLWQIPDQLAATLVHLSSLGIGSVLEIGTCDGWTSSVMAAYLGRFRPGLRFVTVDIDGQFTLHDAVNATVPIEYHGKSTAEAFVDERFDLVFIDGNHDYEYVSKDYDLVGRPARLCMFHDIDDRNVGENNVPRFWRELKEREKAEADFAEFLGPAGVMGIGVRVRRGAAILDDGFWVCDRNPRCASHLSH